MKIDRLPYLRWIIITLATGFIVYDYFIQVAPSVITQELMADFSINAIELGILGGFFFFGYMLMQLPAGYLIDQYGARRCLSMAVLVSGFGVILFALSNTLIAASLSRLLIGGGSAFAFLGGLYLASRWFSNKRFAMLAGILQLGCGIGSIIGEAPLANLVDSHGWRQAFMGIGFFTLFLSFIFYVIIRDNAQLDSSKKRISHYWAIFKNKQVWCIASCNFLSWFPAGTVGALWGIPYLMNMLDVSNTQAGEKFMIFWICIGFMAPCIGWFSSRILRRRLLLIFTFSTGAVGSLLLIFSSLLPVNWVVIALFLLGIPAAGQCVAFALLKDNVELKSYVSASALCNMASVMSGFLGQPLMGALIHWHWKGVVMNNVPVYSINNYLTGFILLPISMVLGVIVSVFFIKETYCQSKVNNDKESASE